MSVQTPSDPTAESILDATLVVIGERGLKGATTRAIAQQAGVHEVTLFRKFGTKNSLIQATITRQFSKVEHQAVQYTGDLEADLLRLAQVFQQTLQAVSSVARILLTEVPIDPALAESVAGPRHLFATIANLLSRYQAEGQLKAEPVSSLIPAFLGPVVMPYVIPGSVVEHDQLIDPKTHVEKFLYGRAT